MLSLQNWYLWSEDVMQPVCWAYDNKRWLQAKQRAQQAPRDSSPLDLSHTSATKRASINQFPSLNASDLSLHLQPKRDECLRRGAVGPFPFAAGPFVAYTRSVVATLVAAIDRRTNDESFVLGDRNLRPLVNPYTGRRVSNTTAGHPSTRILLEDVYYGYLLFSTLGLMRVNQSLTMVDAPVRPMPELLSTPTGPEAVADFYHPSKKVQPMMRMLLNASTISHYLGETDAFARKRPLLRCDRGSFGQHMMKTEGCCARWRVCALGGSAWGGMRVP